MTTWLKKGIGLAGLVLLAGSGTARASIQEVMVVKVPFPFVVEGRTLPAGQYVVQRDDSVPSVLMFEGEHGNRAFTMIETEPAAGRDPAGDTPTLSFAHQGRQYRLMSVWENRDRGESVPVQ
jgi:hypothetical protein